MALSLDLSFEEELARLEEVEEDAGEVDENDGPEGCSVAKGFGDDATDKDAEPHANVPGDEDGGVGGASLVVVSHRYHHVLEGWPKVAVA